MRPEAGCMTPDRVQKIIRISQEAFVSGSQHSEPGFHELQVPLSVFDFPQSVDAAVELDDELELGAQEVGDRTRHRDLTPGFQAFELSAPQHFPEMGFRARHGGAKPPGLSCPVL